MPARALMFQGTGSDVGKSLIVAGLARAFAEPRPEGAAVQAAEHVEQRRRDGGRRRDRPRPGAAGARRARRPSVHMNPVLLKPQSEIGAQVVVQGRVYGTAKAAAYQRIKPELMRFVLDSFARLKAEADLVLVEGAGSASEVNLRAQRHRQYGLSRAPPTCRSC